MSRENDILTNHMQQFTLYAWYEAIQHVKQYYGYFQKKCLYFLCLSGKDIPPAGTWGVSAWTQTAGNRLAEMQQTGTASQPAGADTQTMGVSEGYTGLYCLINNDNKTIVLGCNHFRKCLNERQFLRIKPSYAGQRFRGLSRILNWVHLEGKSS